MTRCTLLPKQLLHFAMLLATTQFVYSQESPTPAPAEQTAAQVADPPVDPRKQQRDALWEEARRLKGEGKFAEAAVIGEKMLVIERDWLEEDDKEILTSIQWLTDVYKQASDLENYRKLLLQELNWRIGKQGETHWETRLVRLQQLGMEPLTLAQWELLSEADRLNLEANSLSLQKKYSAAIPIRQREANLRRELFGEEHPDYAASLNLLGLLYKRSGDYVQAETLYQQALEIQKRVLGEEHPLYATSLNNLGYLYWAMKDLTRAEPPLVQALEISRKVLGEGHQDSMSSLDSLADLYESMKDYTRSEPLYLEALELKRKVFGEESASYATSLNNLGYLYKSMEDYKRAEKFYLKTLEIRKKVLGEEHPDYALSLNNLGSLYESMADYSRAEPLYRQDLEIKKKALGEEHPDYATSLNNLGFLYKSMADYSQAEPLYRQAMEIKKRALGEEHPDYATSLNNLGLLYDSMADYSRAEPLCRQALEIRKKVLGKEHPDYAGSLNNLSLLYNSMGDYSRAEPLCRQAMEIWRKVLGEEHPHYATSVNNLGLLYESMADYSRAEPLLRQALEIRKKVLGKEHPDYANSLNNLGSLYRSMGDYSRAEPLYRPALEIWKTVLGEVHPDVALAHSNLGLLLMCLDRQPDAEAELEQAAAISLSHLQRTFLVQTERQKLILLEKVRVRLDGWLSVASGAELVPEAVYDRLLLWKGIVFSEQQRQQSLRTDPALAEMFVQLESVTRQLAAASFAVPQSAEEGRLRTRRIEELTTEQEKIERQLALQCDAFRQQQQALQMTSRDLVQQLPPNIALVDFLVYTHFQPPGEHETKMRREQRLLAFVARADASIVRIDLGPISALAELIDQWRKQTRYPVGLLGEDHPGVALRKLVWEPLEASLADAETVLISPDGPLCRFPFAALPGTQPNTFLIEERTVAVIPVPQLLPQLLAATTINDTPLTVKESLLLVGAVDYGGSPGAIGEDRGGEPSVSLDELERSAALPKYGFLGQTREEIDQLQKSFEEQFPRQPVAVLDGELATEAAFRQKASDYRWLHLATHGFFAPARLKSALSSNSEERSLPSGDFERATVSGFNPGLLSGIVLTGANTEPAAGEDDGILTALEVAALDLSKVDLAVLSACETGLGEEAGGEGVLGLQRAFQLAGARTVVSSLWRVPDRQTSLLMQRFYHNVWQGKMSRIEALREAQIWILRGGDEVDRAQVPPSQWAAFVLSGDWR
jgi:CHAT domain-containing protein/Flp pilus assembly protein TadD